MSITKKIKIGDVIEFDASGGYCYGIITHKYSRYPHLLAVFRKIYSSHQIEIDRLLSDEIRFRKLYFAQIALKSGFINVVGNVRVPSALAEFPQFKNLAPPELTKGVYKWSIWDKGKESELTTKLTKEQELFPLFHMVSHDVLLEYIEGDWNEGDDPFSIYPDVDFSKFRN